MAEAVTYKKPRRFNIVVIGMLLALVAGLYTAWLYIPIAMRKGEVVRVLDETSSEFTSQAARFDAEPKLVGAMMNKMRSKMQEVGVTDPNAEYWIEFDDANEVVFGALYSEWIKYPLLEPREKIVEVQLVCARAGRGTAWTCETQDLQSGEFAGDQPVEAP